METLPKITILSPPDQYQFENKWYYEIAQASHFWIDGRFKVLLNVIDQLAIDRRQPLKGLDIGCGNSVLRLQLEKNTHWTVDGSDLDLDGLELGQSGRGRLYLYDVLEQNAGLCQQYDFLVLFDVIEHVADVPKFLSACLFHLKKGGYVFVNVPALQRLFSVYDQVQGHQRRYNKMNLQRQLENASLHILDLRFWGLSFIPLVLMRKFLPVLDTDPEKIIRKGFQPPGAWANNIFRNILDVESKILPCPWAGTSLMAAAKLN